MDRSAGEGESLEDFNILIGAIDRYDSIEGARKKSLGLGESISELEVSIQIQLLVS